MSTNSLFLINVICPLLSGIPLLCFAFYFFYAEQGLFRQGARLFPVFLLAFSLYILGRPLQLLLGPYPWPIIINCLREILLLAICGPLVLHEMRTLTDAQHSERHASLSRLLAFGGALAAVYTIIMFITTSHTPVVFELGGLKAYDAIPVDMKPPFFAREVTILIHVIGSTSFFAVAGWQALKARARIPGFARGGRHLTDFATGCLIFAAATLLGSLTKQWWIYYLASVPSAFFIGLGVREDMLYIQRRVERVTPFLRDELFHALGSGAGKEAKVQGLKDLLGKKISPTRVLAVGWDEPADTGEVLLKTAELSRQNLAKELDEKLGSANYLLLPLGSARFVVCLESSEDEARELAENVRSCLVAEDNLREPAVGIGGMHPAQELQHSYIEAQTALNAAFQSGQPIVSYVDLGAISSQRRFPVEARDEFILEFKHVHRKAAQRRLQVLLDQMGMHAEGDVAIYRVRLLELLGAIVGEVGKQGGDNRALLTDTASAFGHLNHLESIKELRAAFTEVIDKLLRRVQPPHIETSSGNPLQRAKAYIDANLTKDLKLGDVAKNAGISISQLQRTFRDNLGLTYSAYLTTMRIQKAKALLAGTDRPITDIAFEVGYNDSNYFSTAFRKHEGISPRQYREQGGALAG